MTSRGWRLAAHAFLLTALVFAVPAVTSAQPPAGTFEELMARLKAGDTVWISQGRKSEIKAEVIDISDRTLGVFHKGRRLDLRQAEVSRVRREHKDSKWNGAVIGAAIVLTPLIWYCSQNYESGETCGEGIPWLVGYGALGAAIGAGLDAQIEQRRVVYERPFGTSTLRVAPAVSPRGAVMRVSITFIP